MKKIAFIFVLLSVFACAFFVAHMQTMSIEELRRTMHENKEETQNEEELDWSGAKEMKLYRTTASQPTDLQAKRVRADLAEGLSTYGMAKVDGILFEMIFSLQEMLTLVETQGETEIFRENKFPQMIADLEAVRGYIRHEAAKKDLETAQKLLQFASEKADLPALYFAYEIVSDLQFFGFGYGLEEREYLDFEIELDPRMSTTYYGATTTWGADYAQEVLARCERDAAISETILPLAEKIVEKDEEIASFTAMIPTEQQSVIRDRLLAIDTQIYAKLDTYTAFDESTYVHILEDFSAVLSNLPKSALRDEFTRVYYKIYQAATEELSESEERSRMSHAGDILYEADKILFGNDKPLDFHRNYTGSFVFLEQ